MKTIEYKSGEIKRINNLDAEYEVRNKKAKFIPKSVWKEKVRDLNKKDKR